MTLKVTHAIATAVEGSFSDVLAYTPSPLPPLAEILGTLATLALVTELTPELRDCTAANKARQEAAAILAAFGA